MQLSRVVDWTRRATASQRRSIRSLKRKANVATLEQAITFQLSAAALARAQDQERRLYKCLRLRKWTGA